MSSFDLTLEPWIPVLDAGTDLRATPEAPVAFREIGLREALVRAHEIREVYCDSPIETVSIYRLLLALFIDALSPEVDPHAWIAAWDAGRFDETAVDAYFARPDVAGRFDLLHPSHPFYQHPEPYQGNTNLKSVSNLFLAKANGDNATLFDHSMEFEYKSIALQDAARGILSAQNGALQGGKSKPFYFSAAPLVSGAIFWLRGRSLFEALLLNAPPDRKARMETEDAFGQLFSRPPLWRRNAPAEHERRPVEGYLDYLTWPARRITLATTTDENGEIVANGVYLSQGDKDDPPALDPLMTTVYSEKKNEIYPFKMKEDRALWRDAVLFFTLVSETGARSPRTFDWLKAAARLSRSENWSKMRLAADVFGVVNKQAKMLMWRAERMPVFPELLGDAGRLRVLRSCLDYSEEQHRSLSRATKTLAEYLLRGPRPGSEDAPVADRDAVTDLAGAIDAGTRYWAVLEAPFYRLLEALALAPENELQRLQWEWAEGLYRTARWAYAEATSMLDRDARQLRAFAEGKRKLYRVEEYRNHLKTIEEEPV